MCNFHKRRNGIDRIRIGGEWRHGEENVRSSVVNAYNIMLTDPGGWRANPEGVLFSRLGDREASGLEVSFTEEEVFSALLDLNGDKALGPNDFTVAFWQFSWDIVKKDVMDFFKDFHQHGRFVKSLNSTFLVLIPKKEGVEDIKDFRPISMVGSLYKLLAKVLANRLKKVMSRLVNLAQNAFVEGRQILDAPLIANEVIDSILRRKEKGVLYKLDIEKAYDQINWNFIVMVLKKMGFGEKWVVCFKWCISTALFSILINGSPVGFFNSSKGLWQGDPLSSYLFVKAVVGGYLSGYKFKGSEREGLVSHLLFADDTPKIKWFILTGSWLGSKLYPS